MAQHREELVLGAVGRLGRLARRLLALQELRSRVRGVLERGRDVGDLADVGARQAIRALLNLVEELAAENQALRHRIEAARERLKVLASRLSFLEQHGGGNAA